MRFTLRAKRILTVGAAGAMMLSMLPAGAVSADEHEVVCGNAPDSGFPDKGDAHGLAIDCMYYFDVIDGRLDGTFGTFNDITRGATAKVFSEFAQTADEDLTIPTENDPFTDKGNVFDEEINQLWNLGLVDGTTATTYEPAANIVRGQFAKILYEAHVALGTEFDDDYPDAFEDTGDTYRDEVNALAGEGIITGFPDGTFRTFEPITRGAAISLLARSAGLLHGDGNWDAGVIPPEAPDTNQTFTVTPEDLEVLPANGEREYEVTGFGDADEVVLNLSAAGNVSISDGIVSFDGVDTADFGNVEAGITGVSVNGTNFPGVVEGGTVTVDADSEVTFTVEGDDATDETVTPVVYVGDDVDALEIDENGLPQADFGIGGDTRFVTEVVLDLDPIESTNPWGTDHSVTVQVEDGSENELALEGQDIDVIVAEADEVEERTYNDVTTGEIEESATVTTDSAGTAEFTYTGPEEDRDDTIFFRWQGGDAFGNSFSEASKSWIESDGEASTISVSPVVSVNPVGSSHTVTAEVTDDAGVGVGGIDVLFDVEPENRGVFNATRTTDADGVATYSYSNNTVSDLDTIDVSFDVEDGGDDDAEVLKYWVSESVGDDGDVTEVPILGGDTDEGLIFVDASDVGWDGDDYVWIDYGAEAEAYARGGTAVTVTTWVSQLEDTLENLDDPDYDRLTTENRDDDADTLFDLIEADNDVLND